MSTTHSDYDMSDSSNSGASSAYSPLQPLPQLTTDLSELSCADNNRQFLQLTNKPFLEIIEQPQDHFRFRYASELIGTHGCLLGRSSVNNNMKSYPTVELVNYTRKAVLKCNLVQDDNPNEHPHKLHDDEQDRDVSHIVPEDGGYMVAFRGIGIIHTARKELVKKYKDKLKLMNLNIVRLKFSAHDVHTDEEICTPVYSEPIHNLKSAATNDLKICRVSRTSGSAAGREDVFMFVEKVNKNHVRIRFFELNEAGKTTWEDIGQFMPTDVHHQYAIAFRTPPYRDPKTPVDVTVYMELVRTTDGRTSEPKEFKYKAEELYKQMKRRKMNTFHSFNCNSSSKLRSEISDNKISVSHRNTNHIPPSAFNQQVTPAELDISEVSGVYSMYSYNEQLYASSSSQSDIGSVLAISEASQSPASNPMWSLTNNVLQPSEPQNGDLPLSSEDLEVMQNLNTEVFTESMTDFVTKYLRGYDEVFPGDKVLDNTEFQLSSTIVPDSGRGSFMNFEAGEEEGRVEAQMDPTPEIVTINKENIEYNAFYEAEDGIEVKKLIKELCEILKDKKSFKKLEIRSRLEKLFDIRLSNGDTFLHMSLFSDQKCLEYIVKIIHTVKSTHLLDCCNDRLQTTLHLAVLHDMPKIVSLLISKGADPMLKDSRDLNAIHYAVKFESCLKTLLEAVKINKVVCNINERSSEKQSALHMAVLEDSGRSARLLLEHGASYSVRDEYGRTPLHLAAYDDRLDVTRTLIDFIPASDIDVTDNSGNTALQIVCGIEVRENTITIARLLLENKANPMKTENGNASAWNLVKKKPALKAVLWDFVSTVFRDEDGNDDDVFVSADEGEEEQIWQELCEHSEISVMAEGASEASATERTPRSIQLVQNTT